MLAKDLGGDLGNSLMELPNIADYNDAKIKLASKDFLKRRRLRI